MKRSGALFPGIGAAIEHPYFVPVVALAGVLLRLGLLWTLRHHSMLFPDELDYEALGFSVWKHLSLTAHGWPTAFRPPAEPVMIGGLYALFGRHPAVVQIFQILLLGALPFLCSRAGALLKLPIQASHIAAAIAAFHPALAYAATTLYPTALTATALTAGLVFSAMAERTRSASTTIAGGVALGVAGSATTTFVPLPIMIGLYLVWKRELRSAFVIVILGMLPAAVWLARNRVVTHEWTLATNDGVNLFLGANDEATPESGNWVAAPGAMGSHELEENRSYEQRGKLWIKAHPLHYAWLFVERSALVVDSVGNPRTKGPHSGLAARLAAWLLLPVTLAGVAGLFLNRRTACAWFTAAALLLVVVSSGATIVKPRFRFPCDPLLDTFAVGTVFYVARRLYETGGATTRVAAFRKAS